MVRRLRLEKWSHFPFLSPLTVKWQSYEVLLLCSATVAAKTNKHINTLQVLQVGCLDLKFINGLSLVYRNMKSSLFPGEVALSMWLWVSRGLLPRWHLCYPVLGHPGAAYFLEASALCPAPKGFYFCSCEVLHRITAHSPCGHAWFYSTALFKVA